MAPASFITPGGVFDGRDFCTAIRLDAPGGMAPEALRLFTKLAAEHRRAPFAGPPGGVTPEAVVASAATGATAGGGTTGPIDVVSAYLAYRPRAPELFALLADLLTPAVTAVAALDALTAVLSASTPASPAALAVAADVVKSRAAAILSVLTRHRHAARSVLRLLTAAARTAPTIASALVWRYDLAAAGSTAGLGRSGSSSAVAYRELLTVLLRGGDSTVLASLGGPNRAALTAALRAVRVGDSYRGASLLHAVRLHMVPRGGAARAVLSGAVLDALAALAVATPPAPAGAEPPAAAATPAGTEAPATAATPAADAGGGPPQQPPVDLLAPPVNTVADAAASAATGAVRSAAAARVGTSTSAAALALVRSTLAARPAVGPPLLATGPALRSEPRLSTPWLASAAVVLAAVAAAAAAPPPGGVSLGGAPGRAWLSRGLNHPKALVCRTAALVSVALGDALASDVAAGRVTPTVAVGRFPEAAAVSTAVGRGDGGWLWVALTRVAVRLGLRVSGVRLGLAAFGEGNSGSGSGGGGVSGGGGGGSSSGAAAADDGAPPASRSVRPSRATAAALLSQQLALVDACLATSPVETLKGLLHGRRLSRLIVLSGASGVGPDGRPVPATSRAAAAGLAARVLTASGLLDRPEGGGARCVTDAGSAAAADAAAAEAAEEAAAWVAALAAASPAVTNDFVAVVAGAYEQPYALFDDVYAAAVADAAAAAAACGGGGAAVDNAVTAASPPPVRVRVSLLAAAVVRRLIKLDAAALARTAAAAEAAKASPPPPSRAADGTAGLGTADALAAALAAVLGRARHPSSLWRFLSSAAPGRRWAAAAAATGPLLTGLPPRRLLGKRRGGELPAGDGGGAGTGAKRPRTGDDGAATAAASADAEAADADGPPPPPLPTDAAPAELSAAAVEGMDAATAAAALPTLSPMRLAATADDMPLSDAALVRLRATAAAAAAAAAPVAGEPPPGPQPYDPEAVLRLLWRAASGASTLDVAGMVHAGVLDVAFAALASRALALRTAAYAAIAAVAELLAGDEAGAAADATAVATAGGSGASEGAGPRGGTGGPSRGGGRGRDVPSGGGAAKRDAPPPGVALFRDRRAVSMLLAQLRDGITTPHAVLPPLVTAYLRLASRVVVRPAHPLYPRIWRLLLRSPVLDTGDVPAVAALLRADGGGGDLPAARSAAALLIRTGVRTAADHRMVRRRGVYGALMATVASPALCPPGGTAVAAAGKDTRDEGGGGGWVMAASTGGGMAAPPGAPLLLDILTALTVAATRCRPVVAVDLVASQGVCGWLVDLASPPAAAATVATTGSTRPGGGILATAAAGRGHTAAAVLPAAYRLVGALAKGVGAGVGPATPAVAAAAAPGLAAALVALSALPPSPVRSAAATAAASAAAAVAAAAVVDLSPRRRGALAGFRLSAVGGVPVGTGGDALRAAAATVATASVPTATVVAAAAALGVPGGVSGVGGPYPRTPLDAAVLAAWTADALVAKALAARRGGDGSLGANGGTAAAARADLAAVAAPVAAALATTDHNVRRYLAVGGLAAAVVLVDDGDNAADATAAASRATQSKVAAAWAAAASVGVVPVHGVRALAAEDLTPAEATAVDTLSEEVGRLLAALPPQGG
ncbi:hypothetical protein MMPV_007973 [Pyropia vietnamensis]